MGSRMELLRPFSAGLSPWSAVAVAGAMYAGDAGLRPVLGINGKAKAVAGVVKVPRQSQLAPEFALPCSAQLPTSLISSFSIRVVAWRKKGRAVADGGRIELLWCLGEIGRAHV